MIAASMIAASTLVSLLTAQSFIGLLIVLAVAGTTLMIVRRALRGTKPAQRARILLAIAEIVRALRGA
ncbi:hypothetical protein [Streptomyces chartreusis]|uniref:hypothetical protein n=1 Tax=Streptomyces chartreusis TaxID=1969 RepID=UPI003662A12E